ncbi:MAG: hypothetical protein AABZ39_17075 [Spirochaetota bacterium]
MSKESTSSSTFVPVLALVLLMAMAADAHDRIILTDGTVIDCIITRQTADDITYEKDGTPVTLEKSHIHEVMIDTEIDKFFNAAERIDTLEKKIHYLVKSVQNFPGKDYNRLKLAEVYISADILPPAEEILKGEEAPPYRLLQAFLLVKRNEPARAEERLSRLNASQFEAAALVQYYIINSLCQVALGNADKAIAFMTKAKEANLVVFRGMFPEMNRAESEAAYERRLIAMKERPNTERSPDTNNYFLVGVEGLNGYIASAYALFRPVIPGIGRFGFGAGIGFDYSGDVSILDAKYDALLFNANLQAVYEVIDLTVFQLSVRLKAGYNVLAIDDYLHGSFELTPELLIGAFNLYVISSCSFVFLDNIAIIPQLGFGIRFSF